MISERQHGFYRLYLLVLAISSAVLFAAWSHVFDWMTDKNVFRHSPKLLYITVQGGVFVLYGIFHARWDAVLLGRDRRARLLMGLRQASVMVLALLVFLVGTKDTFVSRSFLFSYIPLLALVMVALNAVLPDMIPRFLFVGMSIEGAVLVSPDDGAASRSVDPLRLREWISSQRECGIVMHGVLGPCGSMSHRFELPYLGDLSLLRHVLTDTGARSLFLTHLPEDSGVLTEMISLCEESAVRFNTILDLQARVGRPVHLSSSNGMQLLVVRREPLENPVRRVAKRGFDLLFSLMVLAMLFPPLALVTAVMQAIQSPGPLFFRQRRSGRRNTPFWIFKFRTMHPADGWDESRQVVAGDDRIYPFGRFLRRTSLDELPQFLNVLRGEMSVVGPRPHLKIHNETWDKFLKPYHFRASVKPGVTGLAQIRGLRGEASTEQEIRRRAECDIEYLETWSFFMDLWIVLITSVQVLFPPRKAC
jgi:exopolysaccharide biosynthesis polyprenyl glycosylphosphotransferase